MPFIPGSWFAGQQVSGLVDGTVINGAQIVADGETGQILIYSGEPANGNLIGSWSGAAGTDDYGNTYPEGLSVTSTSIEGTDFILDTSGLFYYNGTPALGNAPILSIVTTGVTEDPFGNTVAALLTIGEYAAAHVSYDIQGNGYLYDTTDTLRIVLANGSATFSGITDPSIIFYNSYGAVVLVVDQVAGGIFQYEDLGSATQGALILAQSGKTTTDPINSETLSAGVTLANSSGDQLTQITSANGRIRFNNIYGAAVSVIAPDIGGIFFYNDEGSAVQGGTIGALVWALSPVADPINSTTFSPGTTSRDPIAAGYYFYDPGNVYMGNAASMAYYAHINGIGQGSGSATRVYTGIYGPTSAFSPGSGAAHAVLHVAGASPDGSHAAQVLMGTATATADPTPATTAYLEIQGTSALLDQPAPTAVTSYAMPFASGGALNVVDGTDGNTYDTQRLTLWNNGQTITATSGTPAAVTNLSAALGARSYRAKTYIAYKGGSAAGTPTFTLTATGTQTFTAGTWEFTTNSPTAATVTEGGFTSFPAATTGLTMQTSICKCEFECLTTFSVAGTMSVTGYTSSATDSIIIEGAYLEISPLVAGA